MERVPILSDAVEQNVVGEAHRIVDCAVAIARADWDSFETSWDFRGVPLLQEGIVEATLRKSWELWNEHCQQAVAQMQILETENNRLWIIAYGLQDELKSGCV